MDFTKILLQKIKNQPDIWFFYCFLFVFTLSIRKVSFYFPIQGTFNEYTGIYVYMSDIFLFFTILFWIVSILSHKIGKSSRNKLWITQLIHNIYSKTTLECSTWNILLPLILVVWSIISIFWSDNPTVALFRSLKLLEFYLLYIYVIFRIVPRGTLLRNTLLLIIAIGSVQSIIAISQFIAQNSLHLTFLRESQISSEIPGVAKIILNGNKYIRAYGLFPHPNILAGFLLISIVLSFSIKNLFHVEQSRHLLVPRGTKYFQQLFSLAITLQLVALALTFSKSAIIGLVLGAAYVNVPRGTNLIKKCSTWNKFNKKIALGIMITIMSIFLIRPNLDLFLWQSLNERLFYLNVSRGTIENHPMIGLGMGQFVANMASHSAVHLEIWKYQPVHNVFLLIWSELGIVGLALFIIFLYNIIRLPYSRTSVVQTNRNVPRGTLINNSSSKQVYDSSFFDSQKGDGHKIVPRGTIMKKEITMYLQTALIGFVFILLWDHYSWDIQQGQAAIWMLLGLAAGIKCA